MPWINNLFVEVNEAMQVLVGKTGTMITGGGVGDDALKFHMSDGTVYEFYHSQDCCESVKIEEVVGDLQDLLRTPILAAVEESNEGHPAPVGEYGSPESYTWTFYRFTTIKGTVVVRWLGESNGYYSESVDFREVTN